MACLYRHTWFLILTIHCTLFLIPSFSTVRPCVQRRGLRQSCFSIVFALFSFVDWRALADVRLALLSFLDRRALADFSRAMTDQMSLFAHAHSFEFRVLFLMSRPTRFRFASMCSSVFFNAARFAPSYRVSFDVLRPFLDAQPLKTPQQARISSYHLFNPTNNAHVADYLGTMLDWLDRRCVVFHKLPLITTD